MANSMHPQQTDSGDMSAGILSEEARHPGILHFEQCILHPKLTVSKSGTICSNMIR